MTFSKVQHPNVVTYYGCSTHVPGKLVVVQELLYASVEAVLFGQVIV